MADCNILCSKLSAANIPKNLKWRAMIYNILILIETTEHDNTEETQRIHQEASELYNSIINMDTYTDESYALFKVKVMNLIAKIKRYELWSLNELYVEIEHLLTILIERYLKLKEENLNSYLYEYQKENNNDKNEISDKAKKEIFHNLDIIVNKIQNNIFKFEDAINKAENKAKYDKLTGLLTRYGLINELNNIIAQKKNILDTVSFVIIDLDHFKNINDNYGHIVGDEVLKLVGHLIHQNANNCLNARYGGDEFVIIDFVPINTMFETAQRVMNKIKKYPFKIRDTNDIILNINFTAGIFEDSIKNIHNFQSLSEYLSSCVKQADQKLINGKKIKKGDIYT